MLKGVAQVNGLPATPFPPNTDNKQVKGGDVVTFRIDVTNTGLSGAGSDVQVRDVTVIDDLPTGITCSRVPAGSISDGGVCSDAAKPSRITWSPAPGVIDPQKAKTLTYDMVIPTGVLVNTNYVNRATVTRYESNSNTGWVTNQPEKLTDVSNVRTANASLTKSGQTSLTLPNNNGPDQFTVGEAITYTVDAVVPAGTSLPSGSALTDAIPAGLQYVAGTGSATYSSTGTAGPFGALPGSARFTDGGPTWLAFDSGFANESIRRTASSGSGSRPGCSARPTLMGSRSPIRPGSSSRARSTAPRRTRPGWSYPTRRSPRRTTRVPPSIRVHPSPTR